MKEFKGLKVPELEIQLDTPSLRQGAKCDKYNGTPACISVARCADCVFDLRNLDAFILWEQEQRDNT